MKSLKGKNSYFSFYMSLDFIIILLLDTSHFIVVNIKENFIFTRILCGRKARTLFQVNVDFLVYLLVSADYKI